MIYLSLTLVLVVCLFVALYFGELLIAASLLLFLVLLVFFMGRPPRPKLDARPFKDTPEAWKARSVVPGETREEARRRLKTHRE